MMNDERDLQENTEAGQSEPAEKIENTEKPAETAEETVVSSKESEIQDSFTEPAAEEAHPAEKKEEQAEVKTEVEAVPEVGEPMAQPPEEKPAAPEFVPQTTDKSVLEQILSETPMPEPAATVFESPVPQAAGVEPTAPEQPMHEQQVLEQTMPQAAPQAYQPEQAQYQPPQYYQPQNIYGGWRAPQPPQPPQYIPNQNVPPVQPHYGAPQPQYQPPNFGGYQQQGYQYGQPQQPPYQPQQPQQPHQQYGYYQNPNYQPPQPPQEPPPYYGAPYAPMPPKKKLPVGLKVFFWIAGVLSVLAIVGFIGFMTHSVITSNVVERNEFEYEHGIEEQLPDFGDFFDEDSLLPEETPEPDIEQPDIEVTPNNDGITINPKPQGDELDAEAIYDIVEPSTVTVEATLPGSTDGEPTSRGTGIIATSDGYIITNSHVILNTKQVSVKITTYDGQEYDAVIVGFDRTSDLAVLKTEDHGFTPAEFGDAAELEIGEWVLAIGNPGGEKYTGSLTRGIISGLDREAGQYSENGMTYIQTDAAVNPGNSGGPLVNMHGQVVGINSSKIVSDGYEGMSFAIPVSKAKPIIDALLAGGYVEGRARLGITGYDVTEEQSFISGVPMGFIISEINEDSAFVGSEAQVGDIITEINGEAVSGVDDIANELLKYAPGDTITVTLYRMGSSGEDDTTLEVDIVLLEDKGETQG